MIKRLLLIIGILVLGIIGWNRYGRTLWEANFPKSSAASPISAPSAPVNSAESTLPPVAPSTDPVVRAWTQHRNADRKRDTILNNIISDLNQRMPTTRPSNSAPAMSPPLRSDEPLFNSRPVSMATNDTGRADDIRNTILADPEGAEGFICTKDADARTSMLHSPSEPLTIAVQTPIKAPDVPTKSAPCAITDSTKVGRQPPVQRMQELSLSLSNPFPANPPKSVPIITQTHASMIVVGPSIQYFNVPAGAEKLMTTLTLRDSHDVPSRICRERLTFDVDKGTHSSNTLRLPPKFADTKIPGRDNLLIIQWNDGQFSSYQRVQPMALSSTIQRKETLETIAPPPSPSKPSLQIMNVPINTRQLDVFVTCHWMLNGMVRNAEFRIPVCGANNDAQLSEVTPFPSGFAAGQIAPHDLRVSVTLSDGKSLHFMPQEPVPISSTRVSVILLPAP